jgi:hypothetical protein
MVFLQLRQQTHTLQGVVGLSKDGEEEVVSKQMIKWVNGVSVSRRFVWDQSFRLGRVSLEMVVRRLT